MSSTSVFENIVYFQNEPYLYQFADNFIQANNCVADCADAMIKFMRFMLRPDNLVYIMLS